MAIVNIAPVTTTQAATSVTAISATLNGTLVDTGWYGSGPSADTVAEKGFYFGTDPTPSTNGTKYAVAGGTVGAYTKAMTGLVINTTYYFCTFATGVNTGLTAYGSTLSFTYLGAKTEFNKYYVYKSFRNGDYIGNLPNVTSEFNVAQDIDTVGSQITVKVGVSADTSILPVDILLTETGEELLGEDDDPLTTEGQLPIVTPGSSGIDTLIKNGNRIEVWEYGYYHPNGLCVFKGSMDHWEASFGGDYGDTISVICYSDGSDMDNYLVRGYPYTYTLDVSQASQNAYDTVLKTSYGGFHKDGQSWVASVANLGALTVKLNGTADVTMSVYSGNFVSLLGSVTKSVSVAVATDIQFQFPNTIDTTIGGGYSFGISVGTGQSIKVYYQNTNVYANGSLYTSDFAGGSGGGNWAPNTAYDLYFKTYSGTGSTTCTFTSLDPTTGMLKNILDDYIARGGLIEYTTPSIEATGLSLTYQMNTNTTLEGVKAMKTLAPNGFYFYVDLGTDILYFKDSNTVADITFTKGKHLNSITVAATIEEVKNSVYFTGGDTGGGSNLYTQYNDPSSLALYGTRLDRLSDNRVTVTATADAIGGSDLAAKKDEQFQTTVTILDKTMDITLLKPGLIVGFNGFGTFVDNILAQIVRIEYSPESVTLTLGVLPKRTMPEFDKVTRGLVAMQTILNPSAPS